MISVNVLEKLEYNKILQYVSKYCATEGGKKSILSLTPLSERNEVITEGELVAQAKEILIKNTYPPIDFIPDLDELISKSKIEGAILDSKQIIEVLRLAVISRSLSSFLRNNSETAPMLYELSPGLFSDKLFEHYVQKIINENGEINDSASAKLSEIRREIRHRKEDLIRSVNRIVKSLNERDIVREDYLTLRDGRIVIPIKSEHKRHIRGFIHSESATGQTVYIEPEETLELNNEIVSLSFAERREIERLLSEITKRIGSISGELKESLRIVASLDSIFARAKYSIEVIGSFPQFDNRAYL